MFLNISIFSLFFIIGILIRILFFSLNEILKVADSFAYVQMAYFFNHFSFQGFGTGWFGFLYSLWIALFSFFIKDIFFSAKIANLVLFIGTYSIVYVFFKRYLSLLFFLIFLFLFILFVPYIHYTIHVLSENLYIFLFFGMLFYIIITGVSSYKNIAVLAFFLALLYVTRAEAFIYSASIAGIFLFYSWYNHFYRGWKYVVFDTVKKFSFFLGVFFVFIFPYVFYLHSITGEWGLTNKGISNFRQAELRGMNVMDDEGFERAVGELTPDKTRLISGFVGGMRYEKPYSSFDTMEYIFQNKQAIFIRFISNIYKLFSSTLPNVLLNRVSFEQNRFGIGLLYVLSIVLYSMVALGIVTFWKQGKKELVIVFFSFFSVATVFFSIFFILERYFVVFFPFFLLFFLKGMEYVVQKKYFGNIGKLLTIGFLILVSFIYGMGISTYYTGNKQEDEKYEVKRVAGKWLHAYFLENNISPISVRIMERFPIVTFYSGSKERWIVPYTHSIEDVSVYACHNAIQFLVVDSLDFLKYRPKLLHDIALKEKDFLKKVKEFSVGGQTVTIFEFICNT